MKSLSRIKNYLLGSILLAPALCMAWGAIAVNSVGGTQTSTHYSNPEDARKAALEKCETMGSPCRIRIEPRRAGAFVIYKGRGGNYAAFSHDPMVANKKAFEGCSASFAGCKISTAEWDNGALWLAVASDSQDSFIAHNGQSKKEAEEEAIQGCEKKTSTPQKCTIGLSVSGDGYLAIAKSKKLQTNHTYASANPDLATAKRESLIGCAKLESKPDDCEVAVVIRNDPPLRVPKEMDELIKKAAANKAR